MTLYGLSLIPLEKCPQLIHRPGIFCFLPCLKEILLNSSTATAGVALQDTGTGNAFTLMVASGRTALF